MNSKRVPFSRHAIMLSNQVDSHISEDMEMYYQDQKIGIEAVFKEDQVPRTEQGTMVYVDRTYILMQSRFVLPKMSTRAEIHRTNPYAPVELRNEIYAVISQPQPVGSGRSIVLLKQLRVSKRRGPTRVNRATEPDPNPVTTSVLRSAR